MKTIITLILAFTLTFGQTLARVERAEISTEIQTEIVESDTTETEYKSEIVKSPAMLIAWVAFWIYIGWVVGEYQRESNRN